MERTNLEPPTSHTRAEKKTYDVREVWLTSISVGDQALRYDPQDDAIVELALDIEAHGLLQPIGVTPSGENQYQLLWGGRRLAAHQRLKRTTIIAHVYDARDQPTKSIALRENILRQPLTLQEECDAVHHLHHVDQCSPDQVAELCGKSRAWVLRRLAIPHLPGDLRDAVYDGSLPIAHAEELAGIEDESARRYATSHALQTKPSLTNLRALVETLQATPSFGTAVEAGLAASTSPDGPMPIFLQCASCQQPTDTRQLLIVRICPTCATATESPKHGSHTPPTEH